MVQRVDDARYLNLRMEPATDEAIRLIGVIAAETWSKTALKKGSPNKNYVEAVGALCADLLKAAAYHAATYRPMGRSTFTATRIGYRQFKRVIESAEALELIAVTAGVGGGNLVGRATRFVATPALLDLAKAYGVEPSAWSKHFRSIPRPRKVDDPLVLKTASTTVRGWKREGVRMPVDRTNANVAALARQVNDINAYFAGVHIEPDSEHYAFQRIFNQGNLPDFNWNKGGRLYSMGDSYQQRKSAERRRMRLNGEPVLEIDIRASFLTILHAKLGAAFNPYATDPYYHPDIPRSVMKGWVVMTFGHDRFQRAWSSDMIANYREATGKTLGQDYPIKLVRAEVLKQLPVLDSWESCTIRWGELQFTESEAVIGAVSELALLHSVPALPVHDSIIVPASKEALAKAVLRANFEKHVGVEPTLTTK